MKLNLLKILQISLFLVLTGMTLQAQILTTDPAIPLANESVTVYFDATEGTAGLKDFTGDVYAHTGVLTDQSTSDSDWRYVKTNWGENTPETKLTRISANLYSLEITPTIRDYYGVPEEELITHLAFVFRSEDNTREGKDTGGTDIFYEVYEPGLNITLVNPIVNQLVDPGTSILFEAAASETGTLEMFLDQVNIKSVSGNIIDSTITFDTPGDYWLKVVVTADQESAADSVFIHVLGTQEEAPVPAGLEDGINYIDNNTVQLVLFAPGKENVFVLGDFNNWTARTESRLKRDNDRWWITLNGLIPGEEYAFQYLVDGTLRIADPYTEKVLDPWNDPWISDETYPGLRPYPGDHTSGITSIIQTGTDSYQWQHDGYVSPTKENLIVYELLVRDFIAAHDWETLTDTLNYFSELGVSAIEVMPFNEFEGNESWGYNPSFYFAPDKFYGPKRDLQVFIDSCHGRGIAVIMDIALNHSYGQSPLVQLYYNGSTGKVTETNPWYNVNSPNPVYSWGFDFNHESPATQYFVDRVTEHWLTEYDLDGFRFDFTKGFTNTPGDGWAYDAARISILERMAGRIWQVNPDAYVILEHFTANNEEKELTDNGMMVWGNVNGPYSEASMGYNDSGVSDFSWISYQARGWNNPGVVGYMESHDEERLMYRNLDFGNASESGSYDITKINTALERIKLAGVFFFPVPGPKMIWQFGELGYDFSIDYNGRVGNKPIRWDYYRDASRIRVHDVFAALIHLKTTEPAFQTTDYSMNVAGPLKRIELNHADMDVRILGNFDVQSGTIDPNFSTTGTWYNYFTGDSIEVSDPNAELSLRAGEYRIYTTRRLAVPRITNAHPYTVRQDNALRVFPVPASTLLHITANSEMKMVQVFDINGRQVKKRNIHGMEAQLDISSLVQGVYMLNVTCQDGSVMHKKVIRK